MQHPLFEPDEVRLKSIDEFFQFVDTEYTSNAKFYGFRGHRESNWELKTTLARLIEQIRNRESSFLGSYAELAERIRDKLEKAFKENMLINGDLTADKISNIDIWQYGQHYGLPSPLLDWTRSPFIGLFFAINNPVQDSKIDRCVWVIDKAQVGFINDRLENDRSKRNNIGSESDGKERLHIIDELDEANRRLIFQQGFFTKNLIFPSIENWLEHSQKLIDMQNTSKPLLRKIIFNCCERDRVNTMNKLNLMNINSRTLFPDIEGSVKGAVDKVLEGIQPKGATAYSYTIW